MRKYFFMQFLILFLGLQTGHIAFSKDFDIPSQEISLNLSQQSIQKQTEKRAEIVLPIEQKKKKSRFKKKVKNAAILPLALGGAVVGGAVGLVLTPPVMIIGGLLISHESHNPRAILSGSCHFGLLTFGVCALMGAETAVSFL